MFSMLDNVFEFYLSVARMFFVSVTSLGLTVISFAQRFRLHFRYRACALHMLTLYRILYTQTD